MDIVRIELFEGMIDIPRDRLETLENPSRFIGREGFAVLKPARCPQCGKIHGNVYRQVRAISPFSNLIRRQHMVLETEATDSFTNTNVVCINTKPTPESIDKLVEKYISKSRR